jgi:hypothetical protein
MNCFFCDKNIRDKSANKHKVGGQWAHKTCPGQKSYKHMKKEKKEA